MSRRILVIANPIAGRGRGSIAAARLCAGIEQRGGRAELVATRAPGHAWAAAAAATTARCDAIAVVGGDGTINEVLNGLADFGVMLGVLAAGTTNVLAGELGLPRTPGRVAEMLLRGTPATIPVGIAGGRRFLLFAGAGIDGAMVERMEQVRRGPLGKLRLIAPVAHVIWKWPAARLALVTAEGAQADDLSEVLVTRVRSYGGVFRLPAGGLRDPLLHVLAFRQRGRLAWARLALRGIRGALRPGRDLLHFATAGVRILGEAPLQVDGDHLGRTPVDVGIAAQRVRLLGG